MLVLNLCIGNFGSCLFCSSRPPAEITNPKNNRHTPPLYTDKQFHNIGIGMTKEAPDAGRGKILADKKDPEAEAMTGAFKTPTLRSVAESGPYFHDGSGKTLEEAVDVLLKGGIDNPHKDAKLKARTVSAAEKKALIAWLRALSPAPVKFERPKLP